jgi:hypothetical protein
MFPLKAAETCGYKENRDESKLRVLVTVVDGENYKLEASKAVTSCMFFKELFRSGLYEHSRSVQRSQVRGR